ncbi:protein Shroom1 [Ambystoma mexicanum]|uniref:protein Shroom1 n=1 Tax=Ambystoma mexicanum TaxID=8296 RepID=UPI0037E74D61
MCPLMASIEKELERWSLYETGGLAKLLHPLGSDYTSRLSPVKSISSIDRLIQLPGKVDSAYSSFSGGSTLPDDPTSTFYEANYCLPPAQLSYMDSEYVRAIYSPTVMNADLNDLHPLKLVDINRLNNSGNIKKANVAGHTRSSPFLNSSNKLTSPRPPSLPLLPPPPSPPTRLDSYKALRTFDESNNGYNTSDHLNQRESQTLHGTYSYISTCESKQSGFQDSWKSIEMSEGLPDHAEELVLAEVSETKDKRPTYIKQATCIPPESLQSGSVAKTQRLLCAQNAAPAYYAPAQVNAKTSHPLHSNRNVNDLPESKQYFYLANFHKQSVSGVDQPGTTSDSKEQDSRVATSRHHGLIVKPGEPDENVSQCVSRMKCATHLSQREPMSDRECDLGTNTCHPGKRTSGDGQNCSPGEETCAHMWELSPNSVPRPPAPSQSASLNVMETGSSSCGEPDFGAKRFLGKSSQIFYCGPKSELSLEMPSTLKSEIQTNDSSGDGGSLPKQEVSTDATQQKKELDIWLSKPHPLCDLPSEKITKEKTPMLYHLASGRPAQLAAIFNSKKPTPQQGDPAAKAPKRTSQSTYICTTERTDVHTDRKPPQIAKKNQHFTGGNVDTGPGDEKLTLSPRTSLDDSFMNDYIEKLKTAQKKVLRETSFKRKDLQMSLPIRLKANPSKRPSIEHFKSYSLTHANEDVVFTPSNETPGNDDKSKEETKKPVVSRIGARKRQTKEEKKLYHSEPEKLDQLGVSQDLGLLRKGDSTGMVSNETGMVTPSKMAFENRERARSASNLSKTELKHIQHTALLQYIERKTGQRSTAAQQVPLHKPTQRSSSGWRHSEWSSYASSSQTSLPTEVSFQPPPSGRSPESSHLPASSSTEVTPPKSQLLVSESDLSYANRSPPEEHRTHYRDYAPPESRELIKSAPSFQITQRSSVTKPLAQNSETHATNAAGSPEPPPEGTDSIKAGKHGASSSRGRGKSMEEIGTANIVRIPTLSHSTDQLHCMQHLELSPVHGPPWGEPAAADENQQSNPLHSPERQTGILPKQTNSKDLVGLRGWESRTSAFQRYSQTVQPRGTLSADSSCAPSAARPLEDPELVLRSPDPSVTPISLAQEDDVFLKDFSPSREDASLGASSFPQVDAAEVCSVREEPQLLPRVLLPCLVPSSEEWAAAEHSLSTPLPQNDVSLEFATEASGKMDKEHISDSIHLKDIDAKPISLITNEERHNISPSWEGRTTSSAEDAPLNQQLQMGTEGATSVQDPDTPCSATPPFQSSCDQNRTNCEPASIVHEATSQDLAVGEETTYLPPVKLKSIEDQRCEALAQEIIAKDQSLIDILDPNPLRKTAVDLMEGLFPVDMSLLDRSGRRKRALAKDCNQQAKDSEERQEGLTETSPKPAKPLMNSQIQSPIGEPWKEADDITVKKMDLVCNIQAKLQHLREERKLLLSEVEQNISQGAELEALVKDVCKPNEYDRYMMFIGDLVKVVSLLLCLSMRLARVENARSKINEGTDAEERNSLNERHSLLSRQREDAKDLKENLDRREKVVLGILTKYLSEQQLQDYRLFVKLTTSLLVEQKDLDEKIRFHEEQLERLQDSIPA